MTAPILMVASASAHTARMVQGLCRAGQPVVLATHGAQALALDPPCQPQLLAQVEIDLSVRHWAAARRLRELMARWSVGLVHAQQANSVGWHAARAVQGSGVPLLLTLWGSDVLVLPQRSPLHRWMVRRALRGASGWSADAQVLLDAASALLPPHARPPLQARIPLGVEDAVLAPHMVPRERRILSCRLHKPLYRIDAILRAFAQLPAGEGWVLEVAAAGSETVALQALARDLGVAPRVEFSGMLTPRALWQSYRRAAVFVSVPTSDGTSVSLLEALALGCVPVLSDLPANREWVRDGENGLLVDDLARLPEALARAMRWAQEPAWSTGPAAANRRLIETRATFSRNIAQFQEAYDRLGAR